MKSLTAGFNIFFIIVVVLTVFPRKSLNDLQWHILKQEFLWVIFSLFLGGVKVKYRN